MSAAPQFKPTAVAVAAASAMKLAIVKPDAQPHQPAPPDAVDGGVAEFLAPKIPKRAKRRSSSYDMPDDFKRLVGERMRAVREASGTLLTDAAAALGYAQPVQLSYMENGLRPVTLRVLVQYAAAFDTTADYLLGVSSDPDSDPAVVIQRRVADQIAEELRLVLAKVSSTTVDLARDVRPVVSRALRLATAVIEARAALAKVRAINATFDDECRGGSSLVARLDAAAELAVELLERTTVLQTKAKGGLVGASMTQAGLDEGVTLDDVRAMLASSEPVSQSAQAARVAATIGDDDADEEPDEPA